MPPPRNGSAAPPITACATASIISPFFTRAGMGVTQNLGQSYVWFDLAARQGDEDAAKKRDEVGARLDAPALEAAQKQVG